MKSMVIDFHCHVYPFLRGLAPWTKKIQSLLKPFASKAHDLQNQIRHLPDPIKPLADELSALLPLPSIFLQGQPQNLLEELKKQGVDRAVVIPHPPFCTTDFLLEWCQDHPETIAAAYHRASDDSPESALTRWHSLGAKVLKIHTTHDQENPDSERYQRLLQTARKLNMPVVLHTGCFESHLWYKNPHLAEVENFESWFKNFPEIQFVLAHMNFHDPNKALSLCERYNNLWVDTSWQPAEMIAEAVRRIGNERILLASDWPILGNNLEVSLLRVNDALRSKWITQLDYDQIMGLNALRLLKGNSG